MFFYSQLGVRKIVFYFVLNYFILVCFQFNGYASIDLHSGINNTFNQTLSVLPPIVIDVPRTCTVNIVKIRVGKNKADDCNAIDNLSREDNNYYALFEL